MFYIGAKLGVACGIPGAQPKAGHGIAFTAQTWKAFGVWRAGVRLELLGPFRLSGGGAVAPLPKKVQGLLAYLAIQSHRPVARDHLAHLMWCDQDGPRAHHSLRQSLVACFNHFERILRFASVATIG